MYTFCKKITKLPLTPVRFLAGKWAGAKHTQTYVFRRVISVFFRFFRGKAQKLVFSGGEVQFVLKHNYPFAFVKFLGYKIKLVSIYPHPSIWGFCHGERARNFHYSQFISSPTFSSPPATARMRGSSTNVTSTRLSLAFFKFLLLFFLELTHSKILNVHMIL